MNQYSVLALALLGGLVIFFIGVVYFLYLLKFFKDVENCDLDNTDNKLRDFLYTHTIANIVVWGLLGLFGAWKLISVWREMKSG